MSAFATAVDKSNPVRRWFMISERPGTEEPPVSVMEYLSGVIHHPHNWVRPCPDAAHFVCRFHLREKSFHDFNPGQKFHTAEVEAQNTNVVLLVINDNSNGEQFGVCLDLGAVNLLQLSSSKAS